MPEVSHSPDKISKCKRPRSVILDLLDKFCDKVYDCLKNGFFGHIFTKYPDIDNTLYARAAKSSFRKNTVSPLRRKIASKIEGSLFCELYGKLVSYLLSVRLRVYGVFLISFFVYSAVAQAVGFFRFDRGSFMSVALPASLSIMTIPLLVSTQALCNALGTSFLGRFNVTITGNSFDKLQVKRGKGRANVAFLLGLILGVMTYFVSPIYILLGIAGLVFVALVFNSPEFGTVALFFFMPILPTVILALLALLTMIAFLLKVVLGKRVLRAEAVDIALLPFLLMILVGTFFGAAPESMTSGMVTILFTASFYLVVFSLNTRTWLRRAVLSFTVSATVVSFYGLLQYMTTKVAGENGWVDQEMFGYITGRAVSTLDNPNMLAVYLIIAFPVAFGVVLTMAEGVRQKTIALVCAAAVGFCLIFTWTRGAWLSTLIAMIVFVMIWSRKSVYLFVCGVLSVPFLPYVIPENIWNRFTSIGNTADSSTAYRINILKSVKGLLPDYIFHGVGCGEECWYMIYPKVALSGVEWTAHSHNLYTQIWVQTGLVSLVFFLIFALFLFLSNFNLFKRLSDAPDSIVSRISVAPLKECNASVPLTNDFESDEKKAERIRTTIRIEAAAPLCGVFSALVMGFTDYIWYNYRVYLIFWLACGLSSAFVRISRRELDKNSSGDVRENESNSSVDIRLEQKSRKELKNG